MFPFCLINASVADAEGITFRLVSFPLTLFSSACHIAFPMVLFKKQTGSAFLVFLSARPSLFFLFFFYSACYKKHVFCFLPPVIKSRTSKLFNSPVKPNISRSPDISLKAWLIVSPLLSWLMLYRTACSRIGQEVILIFPFWRDFWAGRDARFATQR